MKNLGSIRKFAVLLPILAAVLGSRSAFADSSDDFASLKFWHEVHALVERCGVRTVTEENGQTVNGYMRSDCPELEVSTNLARFYLGGEWYTATLTDSMDSDGGDLNDLVVLDQQGVKIGKEQNTSENSVDPQ
jgi:hypothetical protein